MSDEAADRIRDALEKPSSARIYDWFLGGTNNYAIDREFAKKQAGLVPAMQRAIRSNRAFIGRAVCAALDQGIRQFVDIGSGLPSGGQAHEVADSPPRRSPRRLRRQRGDRARSLGNPADS